MASDPLAALLLVGMGVRGLSLEAAAIPRVKAALSRFSLAEATAVAQEAFRFGTARDVEGTIVEALGPRIADLLDSDA
jgi:phosphotransferase system enzyme I (PtsI)